MQLQKQLDAAQVREAEHPQAPVPPPPQCSAVPPCATTQMRCVAMAELRRFALRCRDSVRRGAHIGVCAL
jgi:hypothetical protein